MDIGSIYTYLSRKICSLYCFLPKMSGILSLQVVFHLKNTKTMFWMINTKISHHTYIHDIFMEYFDKIFWVTNGFPIGRKLTNHNAGINKQVQWGFEDILWERQIVDLNKSLAILKVKEKPIEPLNKLNP